MSDLDHSSESSNHFCHPSISNNSHNNRNRHKAHNENENMARFSSSRHRHKTHDFVGHKTKSYPTTKFLSSPSLNWNQRNLSLVYRVMVLIVVLPQLVYVLTNLAQNVQAESMSQQQQQQQPASATITSTSTSTVTSTNSNNKTHLSSHSQLHQPNSPPNHNISPTQTNLVNQQNVLLNIVKSSFSQTPASTMTGLGANQNESNAFNSVVGNRGVASMGKFRPGKVALQ